MAFFSQCGKDAHPNELLICEGCHSMVHTFCKDDAIPAGLIPAGKYLCTSC
jgi:hypothetical protein